MCPGIGGSGILPFLCGRGGGGGVRGGGQYTKPRSKRTCDNASRGFHLILLYHNDNQMIFEFEHHDLIIPC